MGKALRQPLWDGIFAWWIIAGVGFFAFGYWHAGVILLTLAAFYKWRRTRRAAAARTDASALAERMFDLPGSAMEEAAAVMAARSAPGPHGQVVLPPTDNWETEYLSGADGELPLHLDLFLVYVDARGQESRRRVTTRSVQPWYDDYALLAFCHERGAHRTFLLSRVREMVDLDTGEVVPDPVAFVSRRFAESPEGRAAAVLAEYDAELVAVMYIARADGRLVKAERDLVTNALLNWSKQDLDVAVLDREIRLFRPDPRDFAAAIKGLKAKPEDVRRRVIDLGRAIVAAEKKVDPVEAGAVEKLAKALT